MTKKKKITSFGTAVQNCPLSIESAILFIALSQRGYQQEASRLMAFLETAAFDKIQSGVNLEELPLNDLRAHQQLERYKVQKSERKSNSFKNELIDVFFTYFPHRIAQRKEPRTAISSLGRGIELAPYLDQPGSDYLLMLAGRELSSAVTLCEFAVGISSREFEEYSRQHTETKTEISFDREKGLLYRIERKYAGFFKISESSRTYLTGDESRKHFQKYFDENFSELLQSHPHWEKYNTRVEFLMRKQQILGWDESEFAFRSNLEEKLLENTSGTVHTYSDWLSADLYSVALFSTPEKIKTALLALPDTYTFPSGKKVAIDYLSEQAPKISAKIQEYFGLIENPTVLGGRLRLTLEMLAPNYRPAQVTSQLENFWKNSYTDIRKELRARYPRHAWPEDPTELMKTDESD